MQPDPTDAPRGCGVTYFIQAIDGGPVKIGKSTSEKGAASRLASLQTGNPSRLVIRRLLDGRPVDGFASVGDRLDRMHPRNRTDRGDGGRAAVETIGQEA